VRGDRDDREQRGDDESERDETTPNDAGKSRRTDLLRLAP
jgi:hypothetical protein